jgi:hypothetical protein
MLISSLCMVGYDGPAPGLDIWPAESRYCLRDCSVGVVDLAWGIGGPEQREAAMECFAQGVLREAQGL